MLMTILHGLHRLNCRAEFSKTCSVDDTCICFQSNLHIIISFDLSGRDDYVKERCMNGRIGSLDERSEIKTLTLSGPQGGQAANLQLWVLQQAPIAEVRRSTNVLSDHITHISACDNMNLRLDQPQWGSLAHVYRAPT